MGTILAIMGVLLIPTRAWDWADHIFAQLVARAIFGMKERKK